MLLVTTPAQQSRPHALRAGSDIMEGYSAGYARRAQLGESKSNDAAAALKCAAASFKCVVRCCYRSSHQLDDGSRFLEMDDWKDCFFQGILSTNLTKALFKWSLMLVNASDNKKQFAIWKVYTFPKDRRNVEILGNVVWFASDMTMRST